MQAKKLEPHFCKMGAGLSAVQSSTHARTLAQELGLQLIAARV